MKMPKWEDKKTKIMAGALAVVVLIIILGTTGVLAPPAV